MWQNACDKQKTRYVKKEKRGTVKINYLFTFETYHRIQSITIKLVSAYG